MYLYMYDKAKHREHYVNYHNPTIFLDKMPLALVEDSFITIPTYQVYILCPNSVKSAFIYVLNSLVKFEDGC